jgi:hypothetical protein
MPVTSELLQWRLNLRGRAGYGGVLRGVSGQLGELMRSSERDFIAVGGKLDDILDAVGKESTTLASLSKAVAGEQGETLAGLLDEVARWGGHAAGADGCGAAIAALLPAASAVCLPLRDLQNMIRTLHVLGIVTRVESARLGASAAGFEDLAAELDNLTTEIDSRATAILQTVDELRVSLKQARATVQQLEQRQQTDLRALVTQSTTGLNELHLEQQHVARISRDAHAGYEQVAAGVREIFAALQFHDSTRQRMEHVQSVLELLAAQLASRRGVGAGVALHALELHMAQLGEARESFLDSLAKVRTDLDSLGSTVLGFADSARELAGGRGAQRDSVSGGLVRRCGAVATALHDWIGSREDLAGAASHARSSCERIAAFTIEIELVGIRMLRLALNAEIQAVRLDTSGAVMVSVAECIHQVLQEAVATVASVNVALHEMQAGAARLADQLGGGDDALELASSVESRLGAISRQLSESGAERHALLASMVQGGEALALEISTLCQGITADEQMERVSSECLDALDGVAGKARRVAGAGYRREAAPAGLLASRESYTMHSEREVHDRFHNSPQQTAPTPAAGCLVAPDGSELGENVELF